MGVEFLDICLQGYKSKLSSRVTLAEHCPDIEERDGERVRQDFAATTQSAAGP